jgi:hypothetical protein
MHLTKVFLEDNRPLVLTEDEEGGGIPLRKIEQVKQYPTAGCTKTEHSQQRQGRRTEGAGKTKKREVAETFFREEVKPNKPGTVLRRG